MCIHSVFTQCKHVNTDRGVNPNYLTLRKLVVFIVTAKRRLVASGKGVARIFSRVGQRCIFWNFQGGRRPNFCAFIW